MTLERDPGSALLAPSIDNRVNTCPGCGLQLAASTHQSPDLTITTLLAVCDVLVIKALEKMGTYILRGDRSRYRTAPPLTVPRHTVHTFWPPTDDVVSKAIKGAWDVVPLLLDTHGPYEFDSGVVTTILDQYVHDLVITGSQHSLNQLAYRVRSGLGLPVFHVSSTAS